jgi:hypothetical protein
MWFMSKASFGFPSSREPIAPLFTLHFFYRSAIFRCNMCFIKEPNYSVPCHTHESARDWPDITLIAMNKRF